MFQKTKSTKIIAEIGVNHNGDMSLARQLIQYCCDAGADAVKFQTFTAQKLVHRDTPRASYQIKNIGKNTLIISLSH